MVYGFLTMFNRGYQDICYFNFRCARPLTLYTGDYVPGVAPFRIYAFNNVVSNLGYVMVGVLFIIIVRTREVRLQRMTVDANKVSPEDSEGIPPNFGLFYAIGLGLIGEGVFSATYHTCPSSTNFQFDTTFMYVPRQLCPPFVHFGITG